MTVAVETVLNDYPKMASTKRLPFQPKSVASTNSSSCSSSDDYNMKSTTTRSRGSTTVTSEQSSHQQAAGKGHRRLSSNNSGGTRNSEYDAIASNGPVPSSYREPSPSTRRSSSSRPSLERANSAPEHVLRAQGAGLDGSYGVGKDEVIIEEKRRRVKGGGDGSNGYTIHRYRRGKMLGKGGFAKVYMCTALDTGKDYAVKIVPKANLVKTRARQKVRIMYCEWLLFVSRRMSVFLTPPLLHPVSLHSCKQRSRFIAP